MVGHDVYNLGTSLSALSNDVPGSPAYASDYANAKAAGANLLADGASTIMNAAGIGAVESALTGSLLPAEFSILDQVFAPGSNRRGSRLCRINYYDRKYLRPASD